MHLRNITFALLALAVSPALCPAGPIDFSYTTSSDTRPGQYNSGDLTFTLDPAGEIHLPAHGGSIELGAVVFGPPPGPQAPDSYTAISNFTVSVVVTDSKSGRSVELHLDGSAVDDWMYRSWDGRWLNVDHRLELDNTSQATAQIGHTRYALSVRSQNSDQEGVYVLTATVHNPEPGTFALAALGLAPLAARAVRRKRN